MSKQSVCIVGAGVIGLWTSHFLLESGYDVYLIDKHGPGNAQGSSGGLTRIIRCTYGDDRLYSESTRWSYPYWQSLKGADDRSLFHQAGVYWMGKSDNLYINRSCDIFNENNWKLKSLTHSDDEWITNSKVDNNETILFEEEAGYMEAINACCALFDHIIHKVKYWAIDSFEKLIMSGNRVQSIVIESGESIWADHFIFCCGPWLRTIFPDVLTNIMYLSRQESFLYDVKKLDHPFFSWVDMRNDRIIYGVYDEFNGVLKIADDTRDVPFNIEEPGRDHYSSEDRSRLEAYYFEQFGVDISDHFKEHRVCQYANSNNGDMIIDRHPTLQNLIICGAGSGHGFKFSPFIGHTVSELLDQGIRYDRFKMTSQPRNKLQTQFDP